MTDSEEEVIGAVLYVANNSPIPADGGVKVGIGNVVDRLCEEHGYVDEEGSALYGLMAAAFEQYNGKLWTYHKTANDGLPASDIFVPDLAISQMREMMNA